MLYVLFLIPAVLCAQEFRSTILGRLTEESGAVVANPSIRAANTETKVATDTNDGA
jgi:hypothetical protein